MEFDKVIKSISYNQHEILYNIMQLYNNGEPFDCDMTYSKGKFYGRFYNLHSIKNVMVRPPIL